MMYVGLDPSYLTYGNKQDVNVTNLSAQNLNATTINTLLLMTNTANVTNLATANLLINGSEGLSNVVGSGDIVCTKNGAVVSCVGAGATSCSCSITGFTCSISGNVLTLSGNVVNTLTGTSAQITVSCTSGACIASLPSIVTGVNTINSAPGQALLLNGDTLGIFLQVGANTLFQCAPGTPSVCRPFNPSTIFADGYGYQVYSPSNPQPTCPSTGNCDLFSTSGNIKLDAASGNIPSLAIAGTNVFSCSAGTNSCNTNAGYQLVENGARVITTASNSDANIKTTISGGNLDLELNSTVATQNFRCTGVPTISLGTGAGGGTGGTVAFTTAFNSPSDCSFKVTLFTGTTPAVGDAFTVTFQNPFLCVPACTYAPKNQVTNALYAVANKMPFINNVDTTFIKFANVGTSLSASTTYAWAFLCGC